MNDQPEFSDQPNQRRNEQRITELEISLAHVQRLYEQLNEVVTEQAMRSDRMQLKLAELDKRFKDVKEKQESEERNPEEEKPPHY